MAEIPQKPGAQVALSSFVVTHFDHSNKKNNTPGLFPAGPLAFPTPSLCLLLLWHLPFSSKINDSLPSWLLCHYCGCHPTPVQPNTSLMAGMVCGHGGSPRSSLGLWELMDGGGESLSLRDCSMILLMHSFYWRVWFFFFFLRSGEGRGQIDRKPAQMTRVHCHTSFHLQTPVSLSPHRAAVPSPPPWHSAPSGKSAQQCRGAFRRGESLSAQPFSKALIFTSVHSPVG